MIDPPKTLAEARKYLYNQWGGNPDGTPYRGGYCVEQIHERGRSFNSYQCRRKNGYGPAKLFCKQHDPAAIAARAKASADRYNADMDRRAKASDINALHRAAQLCVRRGNAVAAQACRDIAKWMKETK